MNLDASFLNNVFKWPHAANTNYKATTDGIRVRTSFWAANDPVGTVFVFPGRADYIEKYGGLANFCLSNNLNVIAIDWRGQGLSERLLDDKNIGHIEDFENYQNDVEVIINEAKDAGLVKPWIIFAHSMGGLIGLRTLHDNPVFEKVVFTSPMWGIQMPPILKSGASIIMSLISLIGKMETYAPTTSPETRILNEEYEFNKLTSDIRNFKLLRQQLIQHPDLQIGGPSSAWVSAALDEIEFQIGNEPPITPALCFLGEKEEIIDNLAVREFCKNWDSCDLISIPDAKHDLLMEKKMILHSLFEKLEKFIKK
jgi:lysophospholipase